MVVTIIIVVRKSLERDYLSLLINLRLMLKVTKLNPVQPVQSPHGAKAAPFVSY